MNKLSLSTERLRHMLKQFDEQEFDYQICSSRDILGPGGGVYITTDTPLNVQHLSWLERRNLSPDSTTYVEVYFTKSDAPAAVPDQFDIPKTADPEGDRKKRAEAVSREVGDSANEVAEQASELYRSLGNSDFSIAAVRKSSGESGLREFELRFKAFHKAVQNAVDEYLDGNSLVMDLILKYQLDKRAVRHGLNVAAFATEMASLLAFKGGGEAGADLGDYFGDLSPERLIVGLGGSPEEATGLSVGEVETKRRQLFKRELAEVFLGGFMHDCGLWNEPASLAEGHEVKGAKLIWALPEVREVAPSLARIVLFHSDIIRLADKYGVVKIVESPNDEEKTTFKREFYRTQKDARAAMEMLHGDNRGEILTEADLRKTLPVALAERYVAQTQDIQRLPVYTTATIAIHPISSPSLS